MKGVLKAYIVTETAEDTGGVIFARIHAEARRNGAEKFAQGDWESAECRRAPEFDEYAPGPVSPLVLIEHGWWFECGHCGSRIDEDEMQERRLRPVARGEIVYCSPWCRLQFVEHRARHEAECKLGEVMAEMALPPFCTVAKGFTVADYDPQTRRRVRVPAAQFTFPGAKHGPGTWRADRRDMAMVAQADYDTYQQLKEQWQQEQTQREH